MEGSLKMMPSIAQDTGLAALVASGMAGTVLGTGHLRTGAEALKEHKFKEGARRIYVNPEVFEMISSAAHELEDFQRLIDEEAEAAGHLVPRNFNALTAGQPPSSANNSSPAGSPGKGKLSSRGSAKGGQFALLSQIRKRDPNLPKLQQLDISCADQQDDFSPNGDQGAVSLGLHAPHHTAGANQPPYSPDRRRPRFGAMSPSQEGEDAGPLRRPRNGGAAGWMTALRDQRKQAEQQAKAQADAEQADPAAGEQALDGTTTDQAGLPHDALQGAHTPVVPVIDLTAIHTGGHFDDDGLPSNPLSSIRGKSTVRLKPLYVDKDKLDSERSQQQASARQAADSLELSRRAALAEHLQGMMVGGKKQKEGVNFESSSSDESSDETTSSEDDSDTSSSTSSRQGPQSNTKANRRGLTGRMSAGIKQPQQGGKQSQSVDEMQRRRAMLKLASMGSGNDNQDDDEVEDDSCDDDDDDSHSSAGSQQQAESNKDSEHSHGTETGNNLNQQSLDRQLSQQSSHKQQTAPEARGLELPQLHNNANNISLQQSSDSSAGAGLLAMPRLKRTLSIAPIRSAPVHIKPGRAASLSNIGEKQSLSRIIGGMPTLVNETRAVPSRSVLRQMFLDGNMHRQHAVQSSASQPSGRTQGPTQPRTRSATRGRPAAFQPDWRPSGTVRVCAPRVYERVSWAGRESQLIPKDRPSSATACPGCIKPSWRPAGHDGPLSRLYSHLRSDAPAATVDKEASHVSNTSKQHASPRRDYSVANWRPVGQAGSGFGPRLKSNPGTFVEPSLAIDRSEPKYGRWRDAGMAGHLSLNKTFDWGTYQDPATNPFARSNGKITLPEATRHVGPGHVKQLKSARSKVINRLPMQMPVIISAPETYEEVEDVVVVAESGKQGQAVHAQVVTCRSCVDGLIISRMVRLFKPPGGDASKPQWVEIPIPLVGDLPQQTSCDSLSPTTSSSLHPLTTRSMYEPSCSNLLGDKLACKWSMRTLGPCKASRKKDTKPRAYLRSYQAKARTIPHLFIVPKANHPALLGALQAEASTYKASSSCLPIEAASLDGVPCGRTVPTCKESNTLAACVGGAGSDVDGSQSPSYDKPDPNSQPPNTEAVDGNAEIDSQSSHRWRVPNLEHSLPTAFSPLLGNDGLPRPASLSGKSHISHIEGSHRPSQPGLHQAVARCSTSGRPFSRLGMELARAVDSPTPPGNHPARQSLNGKLTLGDMCRSASRLAVESVCYPHFKQKHASSAVDDIHELSTRHGVPACRMSMCGQHGVQRMISTPLRTVAEAAAGAELRSGASKQQLSLPQLQLSVQRTSEQTGSAVQGLNTQPLCMHSLSPRMPCFNGTKPAANGKKIAGGDNSSLPYGLIPKMTLRDPKSASLDSSIAFRSPIAKLTNMSVNAPFSSLACVSNRLRASCASAKQHTSTDVHIPACMPHHLLPIPFTSQLSVGKLPGQSLLPRVQQVLASADMLLKPSRNYIPVQGPRQQPDEHASRACIVRLPDSYEQGGCMLAPLHLQAGVTTKEAKLTGLLVATQETALPGLNEQTTSQAIVLEQSVTVARSAEVSLEACPREMKELVQQTAYSCKDAMPTSSASLTTPACSSSHSRTDRHAAQELGLPVHLGLCSSWMPVQQRQKINSNSPS